MKTWLGPKQRQIAFLISLSIRPNSLRTRFAADVTLSPCRCDYTLDLLIPQPLLLPVHLPQQPRPLSHCHSPKEASQLLSLVCMSRIYNSLLYSSLSLSPCSTEEPGSLSRTEEESGASKGECLERCEFSCFLKEFGANSSSTVVTAQSITAVALICLQEVRNQKLHSAEVPTCKFAEWRFQLMKLFFFFFCHCRQQTVQKTNRCQKKLKKATAADTVWQLRCCISCFEGSNKEIIILILKQKSIKDVVSSLLWCAQTEDYLKRKIRCRPERSELVRMHILEGEFCVIFKYNELSLTALLDSFSFDMSEKWR